MTKGERGQVSFVERNSTEVVRNDIETKGLWIPFYILDALEKKELNVSEMFLLAYIDTFARLTDEGCCVSNAYLTKKVDVTQDYVRHLMKKLKKLCFIKHVGWKFKNRVIETKWNKVDSAKISRLNDNYNNLSGFVYLLRAGNGLIKIGYARNPKNRVKDINSSSPIEVKLIHTIRTDNIIELEKTLHQKYASCRVRYEWFRLSEDDVSAIQEVETINENDINECELFQKQCGRETTDDRFSKWAKRLKCVLKNRKPMQRIDGSLQSWTEDFKMLWKLDFGGTKDATRRINRCLTLMEQHYNDVSKPVVHSANEFKFQFNWLSDVVEMLEKRNPSGAVEPAMNYKMIGY